MKTVGGILGLLSTLVVLESRLEDSLGKKIDDFKSDVNAKFADMKSDVNAKFDKLEAKVDKLEAKMEVKFNRADDRFTAHLLSLVKGAEGPTGEGTKGH